MPVTLTKIEVACPECGQAQMESENFISTVCRSCGHYFKSARAARGEAEDQAGGHQEAGADLRGLRLGAGGGGGGAVLDLPAVRAASGAGAPRDHGGALGEPELGGGAEDRAEGKFWWIPGAGGADRPAGAGERLSGGARVAAGGGPDQAAHGGFGGILQIRPGAVLECGEPIQFQGGEIEGELRCPVARFAGPVRVGPQGSIVAEKISFTELTVEEGGRVRAQTGESLP